MLFLLASTNSDAYASYILDNFVDIVDGIYYSVRYDNSSRKYIASVTGISKYFAKVIIPKTVIAEQGNSGAKVTAEVRSVANRAFWYRNIPYEQYESGIEEIVFEGPILLSEESFMNLPNLKQVDFGPNTSIGSDVFVNCTALEVVRADSSWTSIGSGAFSGSINLKELPNLDKLERIGAKAFLNCQSLKLLPDMPSLKYIGNEAFMGCIGLQELPPMGALESIGNGAFQMCENLMAIRGEDWNVTELGDYAFDHCTVLSTIPKFNNLVNIGESTFAYCERLREIDAAPSSIGKAAFNFCYNLSQVKSSDPNLLPENCEIKEYAFYNLPYFSQLNPLAGITKIGASAFYNCVSLETLNLTCLPNGNSIFSKCGNLTTISVEGNILPDSLFYGCKNLKIDLPSNITHIGKYAFANCESLKKINIPEDLLIIEDGVFFGCTMDEIIVPQNIQMIGNYSFGNCNKLIRLTSLNLIPPICSEESFENVDIQQCTLNTPDKAIKQYEKAPIWKEFKKIYCLDDELIEICLPDEYVAYIGQTDTLICSCKPTNVDQSNFLWHSENEEVVGVNNGEIICQKLGNSLISVISPNGLSASCMVKVVQPVTSLSIMINDKEIEDSETEIQVDTYAPISATIYPEDAYDKTLLWESSDPDIVDYENGVIHAKSVGKARIIVSASSGVSAYCDISVTPILPESISLYPTEWSGRVGECYQLSATILPENTTDKQIIWDSEDTLVASVDENGKITAQSIGSTTVTASCGDVYATCHVMVLPTMAESIILSQESVSLKVGEEVEITATILPEDATDKNIVWASDDSSVAIVDENGKITAISVGTTTITAYCGDVKADCLVYVIATPVESISLNKYDVQLTVEEQVQLCATILPDNASNKVLNWSSNDESIAIVDSEGMITAVGIGETYILASSTDGSGAKAECHITVKAILIESITLSPYYIECLPEESFQIQVKVLPENATNKILKWESSDENVAIVDSEGYVSALAPGIATITAQAVDGSGIAAVCNLNVKKIFVESISLAPDQWSGEEGESFKIEANVSPENAYDKTLLWSSSDEAVAKVDQEGNVLVLKDGICIITATASDGSDISAECIITSVAGIDSIFSDDEHFDIYNIKGVLIVKDVDKEYLKRLSPDIYLIRQGQYFKKLIIN